jgi:hypothetical protein
VASLIGFATTAQGWFNFFLLIVIAVAGIAHWRKTGGEISEKAATAYAEANKGLEALIKQQRADISTLQESQRIQEKRIFRVEIENQRKSRLYLMARQEIEFFEEIIRVIVPCLSRMDDVDKRRIEALLGELQAFRAKAAREQIEWEETKDIMSIYLDPQERNGFHIEPNSPD